MKIEYSFVFFPLVLKRIYHYWLFLSIFSSRLKQVEAFDSSLAIPKEEEAQGLAASGKLSPIQDLSPYITSKLEKSLILTREASLACS